MDKVSNVTCMCLLQKLEQATNKKTILSKMVIDECTEQITKKDFRVSFVLSPTVQKYFKSRLISDLDKGNLSKNVRPLYKIT